MQLLNQEILFNQQHLFLIAVALHESAAKISNIRQKKSAAMMQTKIAIIVLVNIQQSNNLNKLEMFVC